jgi:hypothetical protein
MTVRTPLLVGVMLSALTLGCDSVHEYRWYTGTIDTTSQPCNPAPGAADVLVIYHFSGTPLIPGAWGGQRAFVQLPADSIVPGLTVSLPSPTATVAWCRFHHRLVTHDLAGTIEVLAISQGDAMIRFDLRSEQGGWTEHGKRRFVRSGRPVR